MSRIVQGYALEPNAETYGRSGFERLWKAEHLRPAAITLAGCKVTTDAGESVDDVIGRVKYSEYVESHGVRYEAEIHSNHAVELIQGGGVSLAPRAQVEVIDTANEEPPYVARDITFTSLFLTMTPCDAVPDIGRPGMERKV